MRDRITFSSLHFGMKTAIRRMDRKDVVYAYLSVPYTLGWRLQWDLHEGFGNCKWNSFSSLHFGMKTAIFILFHHKRHPLETFSSLHFGMKTAISLYPNIIITGNIDFQFPTLWDEDCNGAKQRLLLSIIDIFQFPTLWDEDCNVIRYDAPIKEDSAFSSLHFGMKTAMEIL